MNENGGFFSGDWLGAFLIIAVMFGGFGGFGFGGNAATAAALTTADVQSMINAQTTQNTLENIMLSSANNNFENLKATQDQTTFLAQQNSNNLINAIQGFNSVSGQMTNGFNTINLGICNSTAALQQSIADLGYKMDQCCCSIKTTMLENRLADAQAALSNAQDHCKQQRTVSISPWSAW
jgi:hypothetical protein